MYTIKDELLTQQLERFIPAKHITEFNSKLKSCNGIVAGSFTTWLVLRSEWEAENAEKSGGKNDKDNDCKSDTSHAKNEDGSNSDKLMEWQPNDLDMWFVQDDNLANFRSWLLNTGVAKINKEGDGEIGYSDTFVYFVGKYQYQKRNQNQSEDENLPKEEFQIIELLGDSRMPPSQYIKHQFDYSIVQNFWNGEELFTWYMEETKQGKMIFNKLLGKSSESSRIEKYLQRGFKIHNIPYEKGKLTKIIKSSEYEKYKVMKDELDQQYGSGFVEALEKLQSVKETIFEQTRVEVGEWKYQQLMTQFAKQLCLNDKKDNENITAALHQIENEFAKRKETKLGARCKAEEKLNWMQKTLHMDEYQNEEHRIAKCPVCKNKDIEVSMRCGHTFCQQCSRKFVWKEHRDDSSSDEDHDYPHKTQKSGRICPLCNKRTKYPTVLYGITKT